MMHVDHFSLRTARDLLTKLEHDFARLSIAKFDGRDAQFAAFDFFVTAHHLPDWLAAERGVSVRTFRTYPDHGLVSHIANGAKHFETNKHSTLAKTGVKEGAFQRGAFRSSAFQCGGLFIESTNGVRESLQSLATRVLSHWRTAI